MEADFDIAALFASLGFLELSILILTAFFASVVSGISGYGGGMTLGLLVSPFIPIKLLVPLMSVFVLFSNLSRMYYLEKRNLFCNYLNTFFNCWNKFLCLGITKDIILLFRFWISIHCYLKKSI